jgi:molybdenum cofactor cytidylyltransferase
MRSTVAKPRSGIAAIILAAGLSKRAGLTNKLLFDIEGRPMIAKVVAQVIQVGLEPVLVVTGHELKAVTEAIGDFELQNIHNFDYQEGMASSIRRGIRALEENIEGAMICLGDMPWVQTLTLEKIVEAFYPEMGREICRPVCRGMLGNPVLFARRHFEGLMRLKGDSGGKSVIEQNPSVVFNVDVDDVGVLRDLDRLPP